MADQNVVYFLLGEGWKVGKSVFANASDELRIGAPRFVLIFCGVTAP